MSTAIRSARSWVAVLTCAAASVVGSAGCLRPTVAAPASASPFDDEGSLDEPTVTESSRPMASFVLEGEPFCFAGTNNYYLTYKPRVMVDDVLGTAKRLGLRVIRIWAFLDAGASDASGRGGAPNGAKEGVYFQSWDAARHRPAYNDGATGLEHLDYVLSEARTLGLKVVLVLTNNWKDFGGMDQYLAWYGLRDHSQFYTAPAVRGAYKDWAYHLVFRTNTRTGVRYRDDPTIFAWELANEPRCTNGSGVERAGACSPRVLTRWVDEMSAFIKSIDPHHLVSAGDEGFFAGHRGAHYDGADGVDHEAILALRGVDFGTFHLYPGTWGHSERWATRWIEDHIAVARAAGKPTLLEEYGIASRRDASGSIDDGDRGRVYARWLEIVRERGGNGALFWMLAGADHEPGAQDGMYPDYDHFEMYARDGAMRVVERFAATMSGAEACRTFREIEPAGTLPRSAFVGVSPPPRRPTVATEKAAASASRRRPS